jgi:hypothetical protein
MYAYARYGSVALLAVALGLATGCSPGGNEVARAGPKPKAPAVEAVAPSTPPTTPSGPGHNPSTPTTNPTHPTGTVSPGGHTMSVRGAGPYRIGASLTGLKAAGRISWTAADGDIVTAGSNGSWAGELVLVFRTNRLIEIGTATDVHSPSGAGVGMSFDKLERIYGTRGHPIHNNSGQPGYVVERGSMAELYTGNPIRDGVGWYAVGPYDFTVHNFLER